MTLVTKALALATAAHAGQLRKDGSPYITHPQAVQEILAGYGFSEEVQAAALVHDVLEDTPVTPAELRATLGEKVLALVLPLTEEGALPREERNRLYVEAVRRAPAEVKAVFAADKVHNLNDLLTLHEEEGSAIWQHFGYSKDLKVKIENARLSMLKETWSHPLVEEYEKLVARLRELR